MKNIINILKRIVGRPLVRTVAMGVVTLVPLFGMITTAAAATKTIDFESLEHDGDINSIHGSYTEGAYTIDPTVDDLYEGSSQSDGGLTVIGTDSDLHGSNFGGSTDIGHRSDNGWTALTRTDGGRFSIHSIDIRFLFGTQRSVTFTALNALGLFAEARYRPTTDPSSSTDLATYTFTDPFMDDIVAFYWQQGHYDAGGLGIYHVDNLVVSAVPLPTALPLYGAGLGILGLMGWRKRRRAIKPA